MIRVSASSLSLLRRGHRAPVLIGIKNYDQLEFKSQYSSRRFLSATPVLPDGGNILTGAVASSNDVINAVASQSPSLGYYPPHLVMSFIENFHVTCDIPYWGAIVGTTVILRILLLPIAIKTMQSGARMAVLRPDLLRIQEAMKNDPTAGEMSTKLRYQQEMVALFKKFKVNPLHSLLMPLAQLPIFISFFIGLRDMGNHFPEFTTGGALWFVNLSVPDPYYILPVLNSLSFLIMVEIGAEGMETANKDTFKWVMRGLAVLMTPLTMYMPQVRNIRF